MKLNTYGNKWQPISQKVTTLRQKVWDEMRRYKGKLIGIKATHTRIKM